MGFVDVSATAGEPEAVGLVDVSAPAGESTVPVAVSFVDVSAAAGGSAVRVAVGLVDVSAASAVPEDEAGFVTSAVPAAEGADLVASSVDGA